MAIDAVKAGHDCCGTVPGALHADAAPKCVEVVPFARLTARKVGEHEPESVGSRHHLILAKGDNFFQRTERHICQTVPRESHTGDMEHNKNTAPEELAHPSESCLTAVNAFRIRGIFVIVAPVALDGQPSCRGHSSSKAYSVLRH